MPIILKRKEDLTEDQLEFIEQRLQLPIHTKDIGVSKVWHLYGTGFLAFFYEDSNRLIALIEASGHEVVRPGWWIDSDFRGQGFGKQIIDLLADHLKSRGVKAIGLMHITTHEQEYDIQSERLAIRLRSHFERTR